MNYKELEEMIYLKEALIAILLDNLADELREVILMRNKLTDLYGAREDLQVNTERSAAIEDELAKTPFILDRIKLKEKLFETMRLEEVDTDRKAKILGTCYGHNNIAISNNNAILSKIIDVIEYNQSREKYFLSD